MFDSFTRGFRMIWASIKMGWSDKRLILPSVLTVFSQCFFFVLLMTATYFKMPHDQPATSPSAPIAQGMPTYGMLGERKPMMNHGMVDAGAARERMQNMMQMMQPNGPADPNGFNSDGGGFGAIFNGDNAMLLGTIGAFSWLVNRILEGVTTAMVYCHLTEGKGSGKFSEAIRAVLVSLPAIIMLGIVTWIARRLDTFFKKNRPGGIFGMTMGFVFGIVEVFWTLAGHLILPAIVIEGCSFWGGLKRADRIASGNLLTMGIGEVGVEGICRLSQGAVMGIGTAGALGAVYMYMQMHVLINPVLACVAAFLWLTALVVVTAATTYIKAAFYTCLYVWAMEAEAVEEHERTRVRPPEPLALALA